LTQENREAVTLHLGLDIVDDRLRDVLLVDYEVVAPVKDDTVISTPVSVVPSADDSLVPYPRDLVFVEVALQLARVGVKQCVEM
jgi:hypothetical protein